MDRKLSGFDEKSSGTALSKSLPAVPKLSATNFWRVSFAGKPFASFGRALNVALTVAASLDKGKSLQTQKSGQQTC